ncbi:MAG: NAD(P)-dependent oxidoreductase [Methanomicrobiales archaeon]
MDKNRVAITIRGFNTRGAAMDLLRHHFDITYANTSGQRLEERQLIDALQNADAAIAGTEEFSESVIEACPGLWAISRVGVGTDSIDKDAARRHNIRIFNTPDAPVQAVAEHTLALILSLLKHIPEYNQNARQGIHAVRPATLLSGKIAGVIGMGRIGFRVAEILDAIGCRIIFYDPFLERNVPAEWERMDAIEDVLGTADIITLHAAPVPNQAPLLDAKTLKRCKNDAIIINTARGSFIDEDALVSALKEGWIAGAGLDVAQHEPLDGPLLDFPQVIVTPHVASNAREAREQMEMEAVMNLVEWQKEGTI